MSDKPRQWWIHFTRNIQDETFVHDSDPECDLACEVVRVVDANAYDALAAENERLSLENKIMHEALVIYADFETWNRGWDGNTTPETMAINALKLIGDWPK